MRHVSWPILVWKFDHSVHWDVCNICQQFIRSKFQFHVNKAGIYQMQFELRNPMLKYAFELSTLFDEIFDPHTEERNVV